MENKTISIQDEHQLRRLYRICKAALGQGRGHLPLGSGHGQQGQSTYREVRGHYRA